MPENENRVYTLRELREMQQALPEEERAAPTITELSPDREITGIPKPTPQPGDTLPEKGALVGTSEAVTTMLAGAVVTPAAGVAGIMDILSGKGTEEATRTIEEIQKRYIPLPDSKEGVKILDWVTTPGTYIEAGGDWAGNFTFDHDPHSIPEKRALNATMSKMFVEFASPAILARMGTAILPAGWREVVGNTKAILSKETREAAQRRSAAEQLKTTTGEDMSWISETKESYDRIRETGVELPLGTLSEKQTLVDRQAQIDSFSAENVNFADKRRKDNVQKLNEFANNKFGKGQEEAVKIIRQAKGDVDKAIDNLDTRRLDLMDKQVKLVERLKSRDVPPETIGNSLAKMAQKEYESAKATAEAKFLKLGNPTVDVTELRAALQGLIEEGPVPGSVIDLFNSISTPDMVTTVGGRQIPKGPSVLKFDDLREHSSTIGADWAGMESAVANALDVTQIRKMKRGAAKALEVVDQALDSLENSGNPTLVQDYREAKSYFKDKVANRFYGGGGKVVTHTNSWGERKVVDEKIVDEFFTKARKGEGGTKAVGDFIKVYGQRKEAWDQLEIAVAKKYIDAAVTKDKNGQYVYNRGRALKWLEEHNSLFEAHPRLKKMQGNLVNKDDALWHVSATMNKINGSKTRQQMQALSDKLDTDHPARSIDNAIKDPVLMNEVVRRTNNSPAAKLGRSRMIGDHLVAKFTDRETREIDASGLINYMENNKASLKQGMTPQHFEALKTIHEAASGISRHKVPGRKATAEPAQALREQVGITWGMIVASFRNAWRGRTSYVQEGALLGGLVVARLSQKQAMALQQHAFYDPEVATSLAALLKAPEGSSAARSSASRVARKVIELGIIETSVISPDIQERLKQERM